MLTMSKLFRWETHLKTKLCGWRWYGKRWDVCVLCFVVCLLRCAKLLILAYGALRLQVKWPHSQISQITWKHKPNDTLRNDLGKSDGQLYQERLILRLYSCLFINAKLYYKLTALNFTLLGFHGNVSQNGVMYNMWNGLHLHVILWENELPLINGAKSTW